MTAKKTILQFRHCAYSVIMLLALAWLTVSLPFVYADQQAQKTVVQKECNNAPAEEESNPLTNTTEEKTSNVNTLSEYLHDTHTAEHLGHLIVKCYKGHSSDLYLAFHPELISPPPDGFAS